jgi:bifunctional non-homologous end joining protein LigD
MPRKSQAPSKLPEFIEPMLARAGKAFDSDDYQFEIKWDGTRCICFRDADGYRLINRRRIDMLPRYPEMRVLLRLPAGTVLDGEIVVMKNGKPDFPSLLSREQARDPLKAKLLAKVMPATYVVFDQLYRDFASVMKEPLLERRELVAKTVKKLRSSLVVFSEAVVGNGQVMFEEATKADLEGIVAKRLASIYTPGRRSDAWIKIKRQETIACVIVGYVPEGEDDFSALIVAGECEGVLTMLGKVGTGFDAALRTRLNKAFAKRLCESPVISCKIRGKWLEPSLYCTVRFMERTVGGQLRAPVFGELYGD